jgi:hypothetical protein
MKNAFPIRSFVAGVFCTATLVAVSMHAQNGPHGEPVVPPLGAHIEDASLGAGSAELPLDGVNCTRCKILSETITYSGGAFRCEDCKVTAVTKIEFRGAAKNTLNALKVLGVDMDAPTPSRSKADSVGISFPLPAAEKVSWVSLEANQR